MKRTSPVGVALALSIAGAVGVAPIAAGCGSDNSLVGGECSPGYQRCGSECCPVSVVDATTDGPDAKADAYEVSDADGASTDSTADGSLADRAGQPDGPSEGSAYEGGLIEAGEGGEAGPTCTPPLVDCDGVCTDTSSDPFNCGHCNVVCPSQICQMGMCVGSTAGGVVFIGHDYSNTPGGTAQARVLSNAVFIPQTNPLHVLSYERYASAAAVARVEAILDGVAMQIGRTLTITSTNTDGDIPSKLTTASYGVLLVPDQPLASTGALATLGSAWASTLATFTQAGGIVVILDGGTGVGEMPAFSTSTGLLDVSAQASITTGTPLAVVAPADAVGTGVVSPYGAGTASVSLTTEPNGGNVVYVVEEPLDGSPALPVVVHKAF